MPWGNGTGPNGAGAMTGRRAGYCAGNNAPGYTNSAVGGFRRGFGGFGRGFRRGAMGGGRRGWGMYGFAPASNQTFNTQMSKQEELNILKSQSESLKSQLESISQRISSIQENDNSDKN